MPAGDLSNADLPIVAQMQAHLDRRSATPADPAPAPAPAPRAPLSVVPDPEEEQLTDPEAAADPAGTADPADPAADPEPAPEDVIRDLGSLAETLGVEQDVVLESIMVPNAMGLDVPLGEAITAWRTTEENFETRRQELETTYQTRLQETQAQTEQEVSRLAGLAKVLIEELSADFQGVDWEVIRRTDPENYVRLSEMRMRRRARIEEVFKAVEQSGASRSQRSAEQMQAAQREEAVKLIRKRPDWVKTPGVMKTIVSENQDVMRHLGFSEQEIASVTDHRMIIGLHYAAQHLKTLQGTQRKAIPKSRQLLRPAVLRQGSRQPAEGPDAQARQDRLQQFSQARDVKSAASLIETFLPRTNRR